MIVFPEVVSLPIIGQPCLAGFSLPAALAELRAPRFLPESVNMVLFETQWLYWIAAVALAAILFHLGRLRQNRQLMRAGASLAVIWALWILSAYLLVTPRERLYQAHQTLAQAAQDNDVEKILSYFGADFQCSALAIEVPADAKEQIARRLKSYGIKSNTITSYRSDISGLSATTRLTLITQSSEVGPVKTTWEITWGDLPRADWRIERADLLLIGESPVSGGPALPPSLPHF